MRMKEHSIADAYTALDVITCQIQDTDTLCTSCAQEVREVLDDYFALVKHLKNTPLWDVLTYEDRLESPIRILAADNERLKKENNELLKKLGKSQKYKTSRKPMNRIITDGDVVFSKVLNSWGTVSRVNQSDNTAIVDFKIGHGPEKKYTCSLSELECKK